MASSQTLRHYQRILTLWPKDLIRPNPRTQFQHLLHARIAALSSPTSTASPSSLPSSATSSSGEAASNSPSLPLQHTATTPTGSTTFRKNAPGLVVDPAAKGQLNALYSLLENRYQREYPLGEETLRPESVPRYYEDLMREIEEAPGRTWYQRWWLGVKGRFRWS